MISDDLWGQSQISYVIPGPNMSMHNKNGLFWCSSSGVIWKKPEFCHFIDKNGPKRGPWQSWKWRFAIFFFYQNPILNPNGSLCQMGLKTNYLNPPPTNMQIKNIYRRSSISKLIMDSLYYYVVNSLSEARNFSVNNNS